MKAPGSLRLICVAAVSTAMLTACGGGSSSGAASGTPGSAVAPAGSGAATAVSLTLGLVQGQDFIHAMPARVAEAEGFFKQQGLTVKIVAFTAGSDLTKAMSGGSVDVGEATGFDVVTGVAHGVDLRAFYGAESKTPMALIVNKKSGITGFASLKGKKLGISKFGSLTDYTAKVIAKKEGLGASEVKEVPLGAPSANIAALARGDVDAVLLPVNFAFTVEAKGGGSMAAKVSTISANDQFAVLMASGKYLASSAANVKKLVAAYAQAITFMRANRAKTVALAVTALGMTADIAGKTYDALMPDFTPDGTMNVTGLTSYADALPGLKLATSAPKLSAFYSSAFTPVK